MIWDYVVNYTEFLWYYPNYSSMKDNLKFYQDESIYVSGTSTTIKIYNKLLKEKGYYIIITNIGDCRTFLYNRKAQRTFLSYKNKPCIGLNLS